MRSRILVLGVVAAFLAACGSSGGTAAATPLSGTVSVFAAASLSASFTAIGNSFQGANPGVTVKFNYAGTPTLVTQIEQGAPADVFASADTIKDYDPVASKGNGFTFTPYDPWQFYAAVVRAAETYRHPSLWASLMKRAMTEDVSWTKSAQRYLNLFNTAIAARREHRGLAAVVD